MTPAELPLPLPLPLAKGLLVAAFLLHIVFVNLMLGGTILALHAHWRGRREPVMLAFAGMLATTVTVHKSLAVVLGVAPLLLLSVAYTVPFYTSALLLAPAWLSILWLVTLAFLLLYAYKYGFDGWMARRPRLHAATGLAGGLCLLVVPLIYLTTTQLMLDPGAMARRPGFLDAMLHVGNVLPRYAHFLLASLAVAGFWVALWWDRPRTPLIGEDRAAVVRFGTGWALGATALQFVAGPVVLFTLPAGGLTGGVALLIAAGVLCGLGAIFLMLDSLRGARRMVPAAWLLVATIVCMGSARHLIREALLKRAGEAWVPGWSVARIAAGERVWKGRTENGDAGYEARGAREAHGGGDLPGP
jgi:cytochrome c